MRHQERRDSKSFVVVDEDCGIPTSLIDSYRDHHSSGPLAQSDPRSLLLSMSDYDKSQGYNVYDYNQATRPQEGHYPAFGAHHDFAGQNVGGYQAQEASGLSQSTGLPLLPSAQQFNTPPDSTYYSQPHGHYPPAYLEAAPRQLPEIISFSPNHGQHSTKVTVHFRSVYDFDEPHVTAMIMFGSKQCKSVLQKTPPSGQMYKYALSADAPPLAQTGSPSPVPLHLLLDDTSFSWDSPSLEFGMFTYLEPPTFYPPDTPQGAPRKRKLSPQTSPRRSPTKKPLTQHLIASTQPQQQQAYLQTTVSSATQESAFRQASVPETYHQARRFSGLDYRAGYSADAPAAHQKPQYHEQHAQPTPSLQTAQSPSWTYPQRRVQSVTRSPSAATISASSRTPHLLSSPAAVSNPPLVRTSTIQQSPTAPASGSTPFNPYAIYPSNAKALLKIEGELNTMTQNWTSGEREAKRRLVQFRRSQSGSVITATFEPCTEDNRIPNGICVSCILWEEKGECYVTSVDTIQLLEALVGVRFTVEEKNRIRRNLEGFRPATVSKGRAESEEFFKLIMGFPVPKPRNIEKDVKVFPWRILTTALKKIIGKYSASFSSTAGALHTAGASDYSAVRASDAGMEQRPAASPRSASSSATSHGHAYVPAITTNAYPSHVAAPAATLGLGIGPSSDLRLTGPASTSQTTFWHQPTAHYTSQVPRSSWDMNTYYSTAPATGLPGSAQPFQYQPQRFAPTSGPAALPTEVRFVPLHDYEARSHQTTNS